MSKVILLIEDNPTDEKLALRGFKKSGLANEIVVARDGVDALDYLFGTGSHSDRDTSNLPTVVLLDLKLPRVDGLDVLRQIRRDARTKLLPVVVLTASREEEDVVNSYALGANAYVRKPIDFTEFAEAVRTLVLFWLLLNEAPPRLGGLHSRTLAEKPLTGSCARSKASRRRFMDLVGEVAGFRLHDRSVCTLRPDPVASAYRADRVRPARVPRRGASFRVGVPVSDCARGGGS